jgi:fructose-1,6-bisphosphatase
LRYKCSAELIKKDPFKKDQKEIELKADDIIFEHFKKSGVVRYALSADYPDFNAVCPEGDYTVTFDPVNGAECLDSNFSIGSSFGIWETKDIKGLTGRKLICAVIAIYGSRTSLLMYNTRTQKVEELSLLRIGENEKWFVSQKHLQIKPKAKLFASALRACYECPDYKEIFYEKAIAGYSIRYSGVPLLDVFQIFIKQQGCYAMINSLTHPSKFKVLYEGIPCAFLLEKAGGLALNSQGNPILDIEIGANYNTQITSMVGGSTEDVTGIVEKIKEIRNV